MYENFFRNRLIELRMRKDVSAREMSLAIGQSVGYINKIESGASLPSMTVFFYICDYFRITPKEFFDDGNTNPEKLRAITDELLKLDDSSLDSILDLCKKLNK